jgi:hypothetical protein
MPCLSLLNITNRKKSRSTPRWGTRDRRQGLGRVVFLTALAIFVTVTAVLCVGIGKVINSQLAKADGPVTKWNHPVDVRKLGNLASSPEMQQQFAQLANRFPTPRLQTDDGYQEIADMHAKEDLLLENYSWVDRARARCGFRSSGPWS